MAGVVVYSCYDPVSMILVPTIATFDTSGNIRPLYIRIEEESYKVIECTPIKEFTSTVYNCKINVHGVAKPVKITYHEREFIWTIPRYRR